MTGAAAQEEEEVKRMDDANAPVTDKDKDKASGQALVKGWDRPPKRPLLPLVFNTVSRLSSVKSLNVNLTELNTL